MIEQELLERAIAALAEAQSALDTAQATKTDDAELLALRDGVASAKRLVILRCERVADKVAPRGQARAASETKTSTPCPECGAPLYVLEWRATPDATQSTSALRCHSCGYRGGDRSSGERLTH